MLFFPLGQNNFVIYNRCTSIYTFTDLWLSTYTQSSRDKGRASSAWSAAMTCFVLWITPPEASTVCDSSSVSTVGENELARSVLTFCTAPASADLKYHSSFLVFIFFPLLSFVRWTTCTVISFFFSSVLRDELKNIGPINYEYFNGTVYTKLRPCFVPPSGRSCLAP